MKLTAGVQVDLWMHLVYLPLGRQGSGVVLHLVSGVNFALKYIDDHVISMIKSFTISPLKLMIFLALTIQ